MMSQAMGPTRLSIGAMQTAPARREPPRFRTVAVRGAVRLSPRLARITLAGPELEGFTVAQPAASVRLLLPSPGQDLVVPRWNGNEFLLPDGRRPYIRTLTPGRVSGHTLEVAIVIHGFHGAASNWASTATRGAPVAISGPGRGYLVDDDAPGLLLAGDETAIPAISQLLEVVPVDKAIDVHIEVAEPDGRLDLPDHPGAHVWWHDLAPGGVPGDALVAAVRGLEVASETHVWVAGEAAAAQRIRRHLFEERDFPRAQATVRGYWKHGRGGES